MKSYTYILFTLLIGAISCTSTAEQEGAIEIPSQAEAAVSEEEIAINQAVLDAYAAISFEEGTAPDYDAIGALFTPTATMHNFRHDSLQSFDITLFIGGLKGAVDAGAMKSFREVELGGETEYFGHIAHRISSYASYFDGSGEIGERGVNSFQLLKIDGQWIINSVIWDVEKEGQSIPDRYIVENGSL